MEELAVVQCKRLQQGVIYFMGLNWDKLVGVTTDSCPHSDWKTSLSRCKIK